MRTWNARRGRYSLKGSFLIEVIDEHAISIHVATSQGSVPAVKRRLLLTVIREGLRLCGQGLLLVDFVGQKTVQCDE
jgi:hypothetical protein